MITLEYVVLHILLVLLLFFVGYILDKKRNINYWFFSIAPIMYFTIEEGCRWGRFCDWCHYYIQYTTYNLDSYELFFSSWWKLCHNIGLPYCIVMCMCAFLYIFSLFFFTKPYRGVLKWLLPLVVSYTTLGFDQFIRWYVALSFTLISLRYYLDGDVTKSFIWAIFVPLTHLGFSLLLFLFLFVAKIKHVVNPSIVIIISFILVSVFNSNWMSVFVEPANYILSMSERFSGYQNNIEGWLTGVGQNAQMERKGTITYLVSMLPLYGCYYIVANRRFSIIDCKNKLLISNFFGVGVLILSVASGLEFLQRYAEFFYVIFSVGISSVISNISKFYSIRSFARILILSLCVAFVLYKVYLFVRPLETTFIMCYWWNYTDSVQSIFHYFLDR